MRVDVTRVRSCVRPRGTGDVWDEAEGCGAAEEEAGAGPVMALFKRWREMENPWAKVRGETLALDSCAEG